MLSILNKSFVLNHHSPYCCLG